MALQCRHTDPSQAKLDFQGLGFDWNKYIQYRPVYTSRFYDSVYKSHAAHSNTFGTAHDVGAGAGMIAETLAERFRRVIVSEPNTEFVEIARARLSHDHDGNKYTFLAEGAETSSVESSSVDLLIISEAIHWTDIPSSLREFARQLKPGGTLCIVYYSAPPILSNPPAQKVWQGFFKDLVAGLEERGGGSKEVYMRAVQAPVVGFDDVAFEDGTWRDVKRIFTNVDGDRRNVAFVPGCQEMEDRVGREDERVFVENDEDWMVRGVGFDWFQNVFVNFVPGKKIEDDAERWEEMRRVLGDQQVDVAWPNVRILATRV